MANMHTTRRAGAGWWIWLMIAFILIALFWVAFAFWPSPGEAQRTTDEEAALQPQQIYHVESILAASDPDGLVGLPVRLTEMRVDRLAGGQAFWIQSVGGDRVLVVLDSPAEETNSLRRTAASQAKRENPGARSRHGEDAASASAYGVKPGDIVQLTGMIGGLPGFEEAREEWGVNPSERPRLEAQRVYIQAETLQIVHP